MTFPAVATETRVLVSVLFFYTEELAKEFLTRLRPQLIHTARATRARLHVRLTLNYPNPSDLWDELLRDVAPTLPENVTLEIHRPGYNTGFGRGHNLAFTSHPSDIMVIMNSDLFCDEDDWITRGLAAFAGEDVAIVGAKENASWLRSDGCGIQVTSTDQRHDFVDASVYLVRSLAAHRLGLFSGDFQFFYFEDVDMCLRYQQAGCSIAVIPIPHHHLRSASSKRVPRYLVSGVLEENRERFFKKWGNFLEHRTLTATVGVDLRLSLGRSPSHALPALCHLRREHPGTRILVAVPPNSDTSLLTLVGLEVASQLPTDPFDRLITWTETVGSTNAPAAIAFAHEAGCDVDWEQTAVEIRSALRRHSPAPAPAPDDRRATHLVMIHFATNPEKFEGRVPRSEVFAAVVARLDDLGYVVEGVADRADQEDLEWFSSHHTLHSAPISAADRAALLLDVSLFIGPDADFLHYAQLLRTRALGVFGATSAFRSILAWDISGVYYAAGLSCLGCNLRLGLPHRNYCVRRDEFCVAAAQSDRLSECVESFLRRGTSSIWRALEVERNIMLRPRRPSPELDLSAWPAE